MHKLSTGRSNAKPPKRERSARVVATYAELHRGKPCEFCAWDGIEHSRTFATETHHIIGGTGKVDADWNLVRICWWHHQDGVSGFHGSDPLWDHTRAFAMKLSQGYALPAAAHAFLGGVEGQPLVVDQRANRRITEERCRS
jgi:hypothetical protein